MNRDTKADILTRLEQLRKQRAKARNEQHVILDEIKEQFARVGRIRIGGEPINRTVLIEASGLSRRTAYRILDNLPDDER